MTHATRNSREIRRAFTFVEIMVIVLILGVVLVAAIGSYSRMGVGFSQGTVDLNLQSEAQTLFRYLAEDVIHAQLAATEADTLSRFLFKQDRKLVLIRSRNRVIEDPQALSKFLEEGREGNSYGSFPFTNYADGSTRQEFLMERIVYALEPEAAHQDRGHMNVYRQQDEGSLIRTETGRIATGEASFSYRFEPKKSGRKKLIARHVTGLDVMGLAFLPLAPQAKAPQTDPSVLPLKHQLAIWDGSQQGGQIYHIAGVGVHYRADNKNATSKDEEGALEITTKLWMEVRTLGFRYHHSFSSMDEDLAF